MKNFLLPIVLLIPFLNYSQPNTEVFLFDLSHENGIFQLSNGKNISENEGYDNQPSFLDNNTILYTGTRNSQTDIVKYTISTGEKKWICNTEGSEYSPLKIPNQNAVSAIRLDKDGKQVLRKYSLNDGESDVLIDDIIVGYHVWLKEDILVSAVLEEDYLSLYVSNLSETKNYKQQTKIGRSLHVIPNSNLVSYISKEKDSVWEIKSLDTSTKETKVIFETLPKSEDMCWTPNGNILMAKDGILYSYNPKLKDNWNKIADMTNFAITNITRLAVSLDGNKLALVCELKNN